MMMSSPNSVGLRTSTAASRTTSTHRASPFASASRRSAFSTRITELSTTRPKSIAPRLISVPAMPKRIIASKANSIESGIAAATMSPARRLPRNSEQHRDDEERALEEVRPHGAQHAIDELGALVDGLDLRRPRGRRVFDLLEPRRRARSVTSWLFSPIEHEAEARAPPRPRRRRSPRRGGSRARPRTRATSRTRTGTPSRAATTTLLDRAAGRRARRRRARGSRSPPRSIDPAADVGVVRARARGRRRRARGRTAAAAADRRRPATASRRRPRRSPRRRPGTLRSCGAMIQSCSVRSSSRLRVSLFTR